MLLQYGQQAPLRGLFSQGQPVPSRLNNTLDRIGSVCLRSTLYNQIKWLDKRI